MQRRRIAFKEENDDVSQFIWCVRQRPALYNYKLAPQDRRRIDVARGWEDVADEIGGKLTAEECRKKWKNLRDTYHQYRLRKTKFKDCLEKWRYSKDLAFLADIYQPKLKSKRSKYTVENVSTHNSPCKIDEIKISSFASMIDVDESSSTSYQKIHEDTLIENDYGDTVEHVVDIDEVQFCDVEAVGEVNTIKGPSVDEDYGEVCLYEEGETSIVTYDSLKKVDNAERKLHTSNSRSIEVYEDSNEESPERVHLTIGDNRDELDLFFQFLKTKIQKLPAVDITAIQIEFLNAVLRREAANTGSGKVEQ